MNTLIKLKIKFNLIIQNKGKMSKKATDYVLEQEKLAQEKIDEALREK